MARKKYISKSDFSLLRTKAADTAKGNIYESDYMTLNTMDSLFSEQIPTYDGFNFRFTVRNTPNIQKKHTRTSWGDALTLNTIPSAVTNPESVVKLKPNYESIADFAYFSSAVKLLNATINKIVTDFPAELYFTNDDQSAIKDIPWPIEWGVKPDHFYPVSNDFGIDIYTKYVPETTVYNPLRYFGLSEGKYGVIMPQEGSVECVCTWSRWNPEIRHNVCLSTNEGEWYAKVEMPFFATDGSQLIIYVMAYQKNLYLYYDNEAFKNAHIRPLQPEIEAYYKSLDDFTSVLLSRDSTPLYTASFDTPVENDYGVFMQKRSYTFPTTGGYNPDMSTEAYSMYVSSLITLCSFFDDYSTDTIWRAMTHEAMKNLDWTYVRKNGNDIEDMSRIDSSRIEAITKIWGRQYDDLKNYIDSIKGSSTISYNEKNNMPDYCLSDALENDGWEAIALDLDNDETVKTIPLYPGERDGYTSSETNTSFLRRLKLNSSYLHSTKGTRAGVEAMLKLLGFTDDEFTLTERICVAGPKYNEYQTGYPKYNKITELNSLKNEYDPESEEGTLQGLPLREVAYTEDEADNYVIPWFEAERKYDGNTYFQMSGGWGKHSSKPIDLPIAPQVKTLESIPSSGLNIYNETEPVLRYVSTLSDLKELTDDTLSNNTIAYVTDLGDIMNSYRFKDNDEKEAFTADSGNSHYFILENREVSTVVGWYDGDSYEELRKDGEDGIYGWRNILVKEYNVTGMRDPKLTKAGWLTLYMEAIKDNTVGNNPHVGHTKYDSGNEYVRRMGTPFIWNVENGQVEAMTMDDVEAATMIGFEMTPIDDNEKCWYFAGNDSSSLMFDLEDLNIEGDEVPLVADPESDNEFYERLYNPEGGEKNAEAAANSVLNIKDFDIEFKVDAQWEEDMRVFIRDKVMPYVQTMIPSTAIFTYSVTTK